MATIFGTTGADTRTGGDSDDAIYGGVTASDDPPDSGRDFLQGGLGDDLIYGFGGNDSLVGGSGDDTLFGDGGSGLIPAGENTLLGSSGNDLIYGGFGSDSMDGGVGDDTITDFAGLFTSDTISGGEGRDRLSYAAANSVLRIDLRITGAQDTGAGRDLITGIEDVIGGSLSDRLTGDNFTNLLDGRGGNDTIDGGGAGDTLVGGLGFDFASYASSGSAVEVSLLRQDVFQNTRGSGVELLREFEGLIGSRFNDTLTGDGALNELNGGLGIDRLIGGAGNDVYVLDSVTSPIVDPQARPLSPTIEPVFDTIVEAEGGGIDTVIVRDVDGFEYVLADNVENAEGESIAAFERLWFTGNALSNRLIGGAFGDTLDGGGGDDLLLSYSGNDHLGGGAGQDVLAAESGADTLSGGADLDRLSGGPGDDTYLLADLIRTGSPSKPRLVHDTVTERADDGVDTVVLQIGSGYTLGDHVENGVVAGAGAFRLTGNALSNRLTGDGLADTLDGGAGADTLTGGGGDDSYLVDSFQDIVVEGAGSGFDTVVASVSFRLAAGIERLILNGATNGHGNDAANTLSGDGAANGLIGNAGADTLDGGDGDDALNGGADADALLGGAGGDRLLGGAGNDRFLGGIGSDRLYGQSGADLFNLASLADSTVVSAGRDVIFDFSAAEGDLIGLSRIDANATVAGDQAFRFVGTTAFSGVAGQLRTQKGDGFLLVVGDVDGDRAADFTLRVEGVASLAAGDFIL